MAHPTAKFSQQSRVAKPKPPSLLKFHLNTRGFDDKNLLPLRLPIPIAHQLAVGTHNGLPRLRAVFQNVLDLSMEYEPPFVR